MYKKIRYEEITNEEVLNSIKIIKGLIEGDESDAFVIIYNKVKNTLFQKAQNYYSITYQEKEDLVVDIILECCKKFHCQDGIKGFYQFIGDRYIWRLQRIVYLQGMQKRQIHSLTEPSSHAGYLFDKTESVFETHTFRMVNPIKILKEDIVPNIKLSKKQEQIIQELILSEGDQKYLSTIKPYKRQWINNVLSNFRNKLKLKNITIADCYI